MSLRIVPLVGLCFTLGAGLSLVGCVDDRAPAAEPADATARDMRAVILDRAVPDMAPDAAPDMAPDAAPDMGCNPGREECNGVDDDCDEVIDEGYVSEGCALPLPGACAVGATACVGGAVQCQQTIEPGPELCDEADNDCDGTADEGLGGERCETGEPGACAVGVMRCAEGQLGCAPLVEPMDEACTGVDDDCDGATDEDDGTGQPCFGCLDGAPDIESRAVCGGGGPVEQLEVGECAEGAELYIVGQYESQNARTRVSLSRIGPPIVLVVSSYESTTWQLAIDPAVDVQQVIVNGYEPSIVEGLPEGVVLVDRTGPGNYLSACAYAWPGDDQGCDTQRLVAGVEALTDLSLTLFRGCYTGSDFEITNAPR